ncbi:MAG TPA: Gmad2 immunoglobulin-like domain-containing protein, partial [Acidimicrobiales bacterium]|nr:Gmad2 immunoglobulin-like domain-containing protein [Acidimicrobiales bacterium]
MRSEVGTTAGRRRSITVLALAAVVAVAVGAIVVMNHGNGGGQKAVIATTTTTASTTTSTSAPTTTGGATPVVRAPIWPFASNDQSFTTAEEAAKSFAIEYLGMTLARVGTTMGSDVEIFPTDQAATRTVVHVEHRQGGWVVLGADADEIKVDHPAPNDHLTSPLSISGQATAFEATIGLELRAYGSMTPAFKDITMGGANGQIGPFTTSITPPSLDRPLVLVVFEGDA